MQTWMFIVHFLRHYYTHCSIIVQIVLLIGKIKITSEIK
jgi:hypothetical protein